MYNPFKKSFLIEKIENLNGESYYMVRYGWLWSEGFINIYMGLCDPSLHWDDKGCQFPTLKRAKEIIIDFSMTQLEKRLSQSVATQSFKI